MNTAEERLNRLCELYRQTVEGTVMLSINLLEEAYEGQDDQLNAIGLGLENMSDEIHSLYERVKLMCALVTTTESTKPEGADR